MVRLEVQRGSRRFQVNLPVLEGEEVDQEVMKLASPEENLVRELGILAVEVNAEIARLLPGLRQPGGILVAARSLDAPYLNGGVLPGDVIFQLNGTPLTTLNQLRSMLSELDSGEPIVLQVQRGNELSFISLYRD